MEASNFLPLVTNTRGDTRLSLWISETVIDSQLPGYTDRNIK